MTLNFYDEDFLLPSLNKVFSGFLPHAQYEKDKFISLYSGLISILNIEDTSGPHFILYNVLSKFYALHCMMQVVEPLTKERFLSTLENNMNDLVLDPRSDINNILKHEGIVHSDLRIPTEKENAMQLLYSKCVELYDTCYDMQISTEDAIAELINLRDAISHNLIELSIEQQKIILYEGLKTGHRHYAGSEGWISFASGTIRHLQDLQSNSADILECDSLDKLALIDKAAKESIEPLGVYNLPVLDDITPILKHRFTVLVAKENTGKTKVATCLAASLLVQGKKVYFACGETASHILFYDLLSAFLHLKYGLFCERHTLISEDYSDIPPEYIQTINLAKAELATSGLVIDDKLTYDGVDSTIRSYYNKGVEAFFIDHSQSLRGRNNRELGELVSQLAIDCRDLKRDLPIYIMLLSHPSSEVKTLMQNDPSKLRDSQLSVTARSSIPSQEADELFILYETESLHEQGLLGWVTNKRRGAPKPKTFYIRTAFAVSCFHYEEKDQTGVNSDNVLDNLEAYDGDEYEDGVEVEY